VAIARDEIACARVTRQKTAHLREQTLAARIAPASVKERFPVRALVAAAVLFNPAVIALSAVWGQVDAVPAMFVLWSILLLLTGVHSLRRDITAFLLFAVAFSMKPQTSFAGMKAEMISV